MENDFHKLTLLILIYSFLLIFLQELHSTLSDGSNSKYDQHSNDTIQSTDSSVVRDVSETDSAKLQTSQTSGQSTLSLTLSLPNQSELLPIAEEKDSPGGSSKAEQDLENTRN